MILLNFALRFAWDACFFSGRFASSLCPPFHSYSYASGFWMKFCFSIAALLQWMDYFCVCTKRLPVSFVTMNVPRERTSIRDRIIPLSVYGLEMWCTDSGMHYPPNEQWNNELRLRHANGEFRIPESTQSKFDYAHTEHFANTRTKRNQTVKKARTKWIFMDPGAAHESESHFDSVNRFSYFCNKSQQIMPIFSLNGERGTGNGKKANKIDEHIDVDSLLKATAAMRLHAAHNEYQRNKS